RRPRRRRDDLQRAAAGGRGPAAALGALPHRHRRHRPAAAAPGAARRGHHGRHPQRSRPPRGHAPRRGRAAGRGAGPAAGHRHRAAGRRRPHPVRRRRHVTAVAGSPRDAAARRSPIARRRANTELGLLVLAIVVALCAYAIVGLAQTADEPVLPSGLLAYGGALAALGAAAHLCTRRLARGGDPLLLPLAFLVNGLGLVMVRRIDFANAASGDPPLAPTQTVWTVAAIAVFCATLIVIRDHRVLDRYRYLIGASAIVLL